MSASYVAEIKLNVVIDDPNPRCSSFYHFRCAGLLKGDRRVEIPDVPYMCPLCSFQCVLYEL